jgi:putative endonuclease
MPYFIYILRSEKDGKYYIGETSDVDARLIFHNSGRQRSTRHRIPFIVILTEQYETRKEALKRERELKGMKGGNSFKSLMLKM